MGRISTLIYSSNWVQFEQKQIFKSTKMLKKSFSVNTFQNGEHKVYI